MSYDPKLKDYMIGQYTGYSGGSAWGAMGAQHYKPPGQTTPIRTPVVDPQRGTPPVSAPPVYQAPPTPEELARRAKEQEAHIARTITRGELTLPPPVMDAIKLRVRSYFTADGELSVYDDDTFRAGEVVTKKEHYRRLNAFYVSYWKLGLELAQEGEVPAGIMKDAQLRLKLAEKGRYISPANRKVTNLTLRTWKEKRFLFWKWRVISRPNRVGIAAYDRRLRKFLENALRGQYRQITFLDKRVPDLDSVQQVRFFMVHPRVNP